MSEGVEAPARAAPGRRVTVIGPPAMRWRGLVEDLRTLWEYRDLLYTLSVHRVKVRYRQSLLGVSWAILQPLSLMLIYTWIFSRIARVPSEGVPYPLFVYVALLPWTFFSTTLTNASNALVTHTQLVTKVYFPREVLPLTYVAAALFDCAVALCVLAAMMVYEGVPLRLGALYVVPAALVLTLLAAAFALILSATQARFRDVGVAVPLVLQLWLLATPIVYPLSAVPASIRGVYALNPLVGVIDTARRAVLHGTPPDLRLLAVSGLAALVLLPAGYLYFRREAATMADVI